MDDKNSDWPTPRPLQKIEPIRPYPTEALGDCIGPAAVDVAKQVECSTGIAAQALLAACASAVQSHADVHMDGRIIPTSLYLGAVADSGERKSAARDIAIQGIKQSQKGRQEDSERLVTLLSDVTIDGMDKQLRAGYPSIGVFPDEGGSYIGGNTFAKEFLKRGTGMLCSLYGGELPPKTRMSKSLPAIAPVRVSMLLPMTPIVSDEFTGTQWFWDQGIGARFLLVWAPSMAGTRVYKAGDLNHSPNVMKYHERMRHISSMPSRSRASRPNELRPTPLTLTKRAKRKFVAIYQKIDSLSAPSKKLSRIKAMASRAPEQLLRLAAVMSFVADPESREINASTIDDAEILIAYYLVQGLDFYDRAYPAPGAEISPAKELLSWLQARSASRFTLQDVYQRGPRCVRTAKAAKAALKILIEYGWIREDEWVDQYEVYRPRI